MNLALHGLLLQVIVSIVQFQHGFRFCSAGEPGYLDFDNLPETNFSCQGKVIGGYYADVEAGCQMFHVCTIGQKDEIMDIKFLCLNGTVFDQETRVCERVDEVDCSKSERFYNLNLELYGNNAVTLSLHENGSEDEDDPSELIDDHESQRTTSSRPSTTSSTTTTTPRPSISSTTSASGSYQHPNGYPQHYQPQPRFPPVQTSQSKSLYDDKNGGYHHQYIYHTGDHRNNNVDANNNPNQNGNNNNNHNHNNNNNQATSYQLFSNQGVSSTTGAPQIHQIRYSSTPSTQIQIHNDHQPTVSPIFHATSSTIQTLLNSNANSPALINPIFHNHGIASTTEQFTVHNNNPRETAEYRDDSEADERAEEDRRPLEAIQPTTQGKVSKLTISPPQDENDRQSGKNGQLSSQQQRITTSFLPTPASEAGQAVRSFYPTPRTSTKTSSSHVTHIHLPPPPAIPQLKPHQVTINLPPPDIQRIVQNPSPLLPSQSRVIVTAKASVSDESGRPLNSSQLVTLPLPTIPASYDDYKEGDESFDPFYRDVPKVRHDRRTGGQVRWFTAESREKRSSRKRRNVEIVEAEETQGFRKEESEEIPSVESLEEETEGGEMKKRLKTMSKHHLDTNSEDKDDAKTVVDTKESDAEEYVDSDDVKAKGPYNSRESDAEEYVNTEDDSFDSKIFDEPESRTLKDVDVRAVAQQDSKYAKDHSNRLDKDEKKLKSDNSNSLGDSKRDREEESSRFSLALPEIEGSKSSGKSKKLRSKGKKYEEEEETIEEEMEDEISRENLGEEDYYYDVEMDDSRAKSYERDSVEYSKESPNKIKPSSKHKSSRHSKDFKVDDVNEEDYYDDSTMRSNERAASYETSAEYVDSSQSNASSEDSREVQDDEGESSTSEENTTRELIEDTTTSTEQTGSSESSTTSKDTNSQMHKKHGGVLKFTDEIPSSKRTDATEEARRSESVEETSHEYIDDNYEPQSYRVPEMSSTTMEIMTTEKIAEESTTQVVEEINENSTTESSILKVVDEINSTDSKMNDEAQVEKSVEILMEKPKLIEIEEATTILTTTASITTISTTPATTTTTVSTTTPATTTTTVSTTTPAMTTPIDSTSTPATTTTTVSTTTPATTTPIVSTSTPPTTTTMSTTTSVKTTTTTKTPSTTTSRSTTLRPTPPKLFKPFTLRKSYVYSPPTTTPVPVKIKPRLALLNPKPAKPAKSYNDFAPKPVIRKSPLFARKALTTSSTTTPSEIKDPEEVTEVPVESTTVFKIEETTTEVPTTKAPESSSAAAAILPSPKEDDESSINDNNVPISIPKTIEAASTTESQTFTPYPMLRITETTDAMKEEIIEENGPLKVDISINDKPYVESNDVPSAIEAETSTRIPQAITPAIIEEHLDQNPIFSSTEKPQQFESPLTEPTSDSSMLENNLATSTAKLNDLLASTSIAPVPDEGTTKTSELMNRPPTLASIRAVHRRPGAVKRTAFFNCLEKEMYRFYADGRDCRLFHYCSPGFTSRQVLDFRFVCEEGTAFDEQTQSCVLHDLESPKCRKRVW